MSSNTAKKDIRTNGLVLKRTNYGEADRILNLITPLGKISAIARGVRKEKSRLAGSIEMFTLTDYNLHVGKGDLAVVTGAKMVKYYGGIIKDFRRMELMGMIFKRVNKLADSSDSEEYFNIAKQSLAGLNDGFDVRLVEIWALMNLMRAAGEDINLQRDDKGDKLLVEQKYDWSVSDNCFIANENGKYDGDDIKLLRLILSVDLPVVNRVKGVVGMLDKIFGLANIIVQM